MCDYLSWDKTVQTLDAVLSVASRPGFCADPACPGRHMRLLAAEGQQIAPRGSTYGYDVLARVGWLRQERRDTYVEIQADLGVSRAVSLSASLSAITCLPRATILGLPGTERSTARWFDHQP